MKLTGRIRSFDKYSVVLEANGQEQLIFKHAISTVVMGRVAATHVAHVPHPDKAAGAASGQARCRRRALRAPKDRKGVFGLGSSHSKKSRGTARRVQRVPLGTKSHREEPERERAFLVGMDVRTRGRGGGKGVVTAQAAVAREAAAMQPAERRNPTASPEFPSSMLTSRWRSCAPWRRARGPTWSARFCSGATVPTRRP